jgi:tRNA(Leu) C34 or U34 (ribose-2'-O)-methylase TrmL
MTWLGRRGYAAVGLVGPKNVINVGGVLRACACYGAACVMVENGRYKQSADDTTKAWRHIPLLSVPSLLDAVPFGCIPIVVEITDGAESLVKFQHPERAFYLFGPEDNSVPERIMSRVKRVVKVPTRYCMNLAATVNVVLYDRLAKGGPDEPTC